MGRLTSDEEGGDHVVGGENGDARDDNGAGGGGSNGARPGDAATAVGIEAVVRADGDREESEDGGFEKAFADVAPLHGGVNRGPINSGFERQDDGAGEVAAKHADETEEGGVYGVNNEGGDEARGDEVGVGVGPHGFEGVNLFAVALDAEFGGEGGASLADEHQSGEDGAEFTHESERDKGAEHSGGTEAVEDVVALESEDEAGEEADNEDDWDAANALFVDSAEDASAEFARADGRGERLACELGEVAEFLNGQKCVIAKGAQHVDGR